MQAVVRFVVPGTPRGAQRARFRRVKPRNKPEFVTTYTPAQTAAEQSAIRLFAAQAMAGRPPLDGPIDFRVTAYFPVPASWSKRKREDAFADRVRPTGKPDHDNLSKLICDAVKGVLWLDDAQITEAHVWKRFSNEPRIAVEVRAITLAISTG